MHTLTTARRDALEFLKKSITAVIATSHDNIPSASTVYYTVDDNFNFYFVSEENTAKHANIMNNKKVALVVGTGPEHISVTVQGDAVLLSTEEEIAVYQRLIFMMMAEHIDKWPAMDMEKFKKKATFIFKVVPETLTFMNLDDTDYPESISNKYVRIIP